MTTPGFMTNSHSTDSETASSADSVMASTRLMSVDYQVFGKVQGVFFRKYTKNKATSLGLVGWVKNTETGTVMGTVQGATDKIKLMKVWLEREGSPQSKISKCEFSNERQIGSVEFKDFKVVQ